jgi:hypothetical protein
MSTDSCRKFLIVPTDDAARIERRQKSITPQTERRHAADRLWRDLENVPVIRRK